MKKILLISLFVILANGISLAVEVKEENERKWLIHSYNYGKEGSTCSNIYFNYGTPQFTVNSDDPMMLKKLYDACIVGQNNRSNGNNDLPSLLDTVKKRN
jgi:hypothetical protein